MKKLTFTTTILAPVEKVWSKMLKQESYKEWTKAFAEGSDYQGSWEQGAAITFGDGKGNGMVAEIAENRPHEYISIRHTGMMEDGKLNENPEILALFPAYENYTFVSVDEQTTTLTVDTDVDDEWESMMAEMWPRALELLKEICEA